MYTIERLTCADDFDTDLALWLVNEAKVLSELYDGVFDHKTFDFISYAEKRVFFLCRKNGEPVGIMLCSLFRSGFDRSKTILMQELLYVKSPEFKATYKLLHHFIDFGRSQANHVITMIGLKTNIKARSLEKLGFKKFEELYRMEI